MRIYLSASSAPSESARVQQALAALRARGILITSTWPDVIAKVGSANPRDASASDRATWARTDLAEIDDADAVWFLVPPVTAPTRGAWLEVGWALHTGKPVVFSGDTKQSVFCALGVECASDDEALAVIECCALTTADSPAPPAVAASVGPAGGEAGDLLQPFRDALARHDAEYAALLAAGEVGPAAVEQPCTHADSYGSAVDYGVCLLCGRHTGRIDAPAITRTPAVELGEEES